MDEDVVPPAAPRQLEAERRELQRVAYGREASEEERRIALGRLEALAAVGSAPGSAGSAAAQQSPPVEVPAEESARDQKTPPAGVRVLWVAAAVAAVAGIALGLTTEEQRPALEVFSRAQTDAERDAPGWVARALEAAQAESEEPGTEDSLAASIRIPPGSPAGGAFAFRDEDTICLAAAEAFNCVTPAAFAQAGVQLDVVGPAPWTGQGGVSYRWGPRGWLRTENVRLGSVELRNMDPSEWPRLMNRCMQQHRYGVSTAANGATYPATDEIASTLSVAIARVDCLTRFPLEGPYFSVDPG